jgi:hypothetical protein
LEGGGGAAAHQHGPAFIVAKSHVALGDEDLAEIEDFVPRILDHARHDHADSGAIDHGDVVRTMRQLRHELREFRVGESCQVFAPGGSVHRARNAPSPAPGRLAGRGDTSKRVEAAGGFPFASMTLDLACDGEIKER